MRKNRYYIPGWALFALPMLFFCSYHPFAYGQTSPIISTQTEQLLSSSVAQKFSEIAHEIANTDSKKDINSPTAEQAIIFLTAATNLDSRASYLLPDIIELLCSVAPLPIIDSNDTSASARQQQDRNEMLIRLLAKYVDESSNLEVAEKAIRYLMDQFDSREQREKLLDELLRKLRGKNAFLTSELATLLGLLTAEKADFETAKSHFFKAYNNNKYNKIAVEKLLELAPGLLTPAAYLEHLRLVSGQNPLDLEAVLRIAGYSQYLQLYQTSADAYQYATELFSYLYPPQSLPTYIYLPWATSNYNTPYNWHKCLQIAKDVRQSGRFDLTLETIAAKAAQKTGNTEQARQIIQEAENKAIENFQSQIANRKSQVENSLLLAWFYCFGLPDANEALSWANKTLSIDPNSATATSILAYALVMNGQTDLAKPLLENQQRNQTANLAMAQIQLAQGEKESAVENLKAAIAPDPGSLVAELAKDTLQQLDSQYIPPIDPNIILTALKNSFGQRFIPQFISPEKIISTRLNTRGSEFLYGSKFNGIVSITNISSEPFAISDDGLLKCNIRIDANVSGDISKKIPNLVYVKFRSGSPVEPSQTIFIPVRLFTGELRQILLTYPQASIEIEFTVYLDPVTTAEGRITNELAEIKPTKLAVKRSGIQLTSRYLQNRSNSLTTGTQGQKNNAAELFISLLAEQNAMANRQPPYKFVYADWMPAMLKSALMHTLADDDWVVKTSTMASMLSMPLDYELINALSENLNDTHWPARLIALYLLAKSPNNNFGKVLDWTVKYDPNKLVRDMAIALGAARPQVRQPVNLQPTDKVEELPPSSQE